MPPRLGLLHQRDFRQLFFADTVSQIGSQVTQIALPLVAILVLKASPFEVGVLAACDTAAFLLVGLPAGAWVDRMRRRNVLIVGDLGRAVLLGSVPIAYELGVLSMPQLFVVGLGTGLFTVFFDVAYQSYLPHLVGRDALVEGNAKLEAVRGVSQIGGPTAAGWLIQLLTAPVAIIVDAVSFVFSAIFVGFIRKREEKPERKPDAHLGREIAEGFNFVVRNRILRSIAMCTGSSNLFSAIASSMFLVILARELHLGAGFIGVIFSFSSIGGLLGAFTAQKVAKWLGQGPAIWMSVAFTAPFALFAPMVEKGWLLVAATAGQVLVWYGAVVYNINQVSYRQAITPDRLLGRMNATMRFLVWGTLPLGGLIGGALGSLIGVRPTVWVGAVGGMLAFLPVFFSPLRNARELPVPPGDEPPAPSQEEHVDILDDGLEGDVKNPQATIS
jgi:hypothetical protein